MSQETVTSQPGELAPKQAARLRRRLSGRGDRVFKLLSGGAGVTLLVIMAAIAAFLIVQAIPALRANKANFFTYKQFTPDNTPPKFGIAVLAFGTVMTSIVALVIATPVAIGIALFISHYAPRRIASGLGYIVDLLAAVPSVVYGLWGALFLVQRIVGPEGWLNRFFSSPFLRWFPPFKLFATNPRNSEFVAGKSIFTAGIVLAIMILPIITAISREVFLRTPRAHEEAALALGATRWEMIRIAVLPFGRSGVVSAAMLGLGRALGETIAVAMILPAGFVLSWHILTPTGNSIAANIANYFGEAGTTGRKALIATGLVLFVITLVVNMAARLVVSRRAGNGAS